jgi:sugar O-acyltransferase (sialic acid O-acetyltransferase NeuD family)
LAKPLLIFGAGALAEQARYYFAEHGGRHIEAFTVDAAYVGEGRFDGLPVLDFTEAQKRFPPATHELFVAIGYTRLNQARKRSFLAARALGYTLPSFVHPTASVARNVTLGANTLLREMAVISPFAVLGDDICIGTHAMVSHHARVGSHCWLSAGTLVCGESRVGEACFIGANATVRDGITVGADCVIGAGALIMADCGPGGVYAVAGTPRKKPRSR